MPQASEEVRREAQKHGVDDDCIAWEYLKSQGWTHGGHFMLTKQSAHESITEKEWAAVEYLCDEWDWAFAGLTAPTLPGQKET